MTSMARRSRRSELSRLATCSSRSTISSPSHSSYSDFDPALFKYSSYKDKTYFIPIGWNNIMINYNRKLFKDAGVDFPKDVDLGRIPRGREETDRARRRGQCDPIRLRSSEPVLLRAALVLHERNVGAQRRLDGLQHARSQGIRIAAVPLRSDPCRQGFADSGQGLDGQPVHRRTGRDDLARPLDRRERHGGQARHGCRHSSDQSQRLHGDRLRRLWRSRRRRNIRSLPKSSSAS